MCFSSLGTIMNQMQLRMTLKDENWLEKIIVYRCHLADSPLDEQCPAKYGKMHNDASQSNPKSMAHLINAFQCMLPIPVPIRRLHVRAVCCYNTMPITIVGERSPKRKSEP